MAMRAMRAAAARCWRTPRSAPRGQLCAPRVWARFCSGQPEPPAELQGFPHCTRVQVRWGDMDAFHHVNNVMYAQYLEVARCNILQELHTAVPHHGFFSLPPGTCSPILASQFLKYVRPMTPPDDAVIGTRIRDITSNSFVLEHKMASAKTGEVTMVAEVKCVVLNYKTGKRVDSIPDDLLSAMKRYA
eukprot:TRINITY_DN18279_c0_g1_i1.p1 TRINITY_DN18279_c0_g1~~TRINITY_DN18279_c0_g1_i1.p1  ORF type:complete len:204 (+),score=56.90 TRINITY_DN18279_c0_g1_i1:49-612(+)